VEIGMIFEILFYGLGFLAPVLIPILIIVWFVRRKTKQRLVDNEQAILSLRGDISDVKARLRIVETRVGRLRSAYGVRRNRSLDQKKNACRKQ
jgi:hypothetical protein